MKSTSKISLVVVLSAAGLAACRSSVLDPFSAPPSDQRMVGPGGGTVVVASGASVTVPAGAVMQPTLVGVAVAPATGMPAIPPRVTPVGSVVALTPHGSSFAVPVTIRIPFDPAQAGARRQELKLYTALPGGAWTEVPGARLASSGFEADVRHFSFYVVGYESTVVTFAERQGRKADLLFMVDNSRSMLPLQTKLLASFPALIQALQSLPGGLPDVHIGVVSSDMGAGASSVELCNNDQGILQSAPRGTCTSSPLQPGQTFIAAGENESTKNYTGTIADAFSCIAALGQEGCGFEQPLESVAAALGARGVPLPPENAGFLRPDALLGIVLITNEDDCSVPADSDLFDTTSRLVSDPLGPLTSYRCNEYGHVCAGGVRPPRVHPGTGKRVVLDDCHSAEDGLLNRIADYAQLFKGLKDDPSQVYLATLMGPPTPYGVTWVAPLITEDPSLWPSVEHSCMQTTGEYADPAVRIADLVSSFGATGSTSSICGDSFESALTNIGAALTLGLGPRCLPAAAVDPLAPALRSTCTVYESLPSGGGFRAETPLPACGAGVTGSACYAVVPNMLCADSSAELTVSRGDPAPEGAILVVRCGSGSLGCPQGVECP